MCNVTCFKSINFIIINISFTQAGLTLIEVIFFRSSYIALYKEIKLGTFKPIINFDEIEFNFNVIMKR